MDLEALCDVGFDHDYEENLSLIINTKLEFKGINVEVKNGNEVEKIFEKYFKIDDFILIPPEDPSNEYTDFFFKPK